MFNKKILLTCGLVLMMGITACGPSSPQSESKHDSEPTSSDVTSEDSHGGEISEPTSEEPSEPSTSESHGEDTSESHGGETSESEEIGRYEVSESFFEEKITNLGYFKKGSNLTITYEMTNTQGEAMSGYLANQDGRIHFYSGDGADVYLDPKDDGSYDIYVFDLDSDEWVTMNYAAAYAEQYIAMYAAFIMPSIEFDKLTYIESIRAYEAHDYTIVSADGTTLTLSDIHLEFENGVLYSFYFKGVSEGVEYQLNGRVVNYESTTVNLPDITPDPEIVHVEAIRLEKSKVEAYEGDEPISLKATVLPDNATDKTLSWYSSDLSVCIAYDGVLTFHGAGEATITVTSVQDPTVKATCEVIVRSKDPIIDKNPLVGVTLKYKANSFEGATDYIPSEEYDATWVEEQMNGLTISLFDDGVAKPGKEDEVAKASFEMYKVDETNKVNYAFRGHYETDNYCLYATIEAYYNGNTGRWYHMNHMNNFNQPCYAIETHFYYDAEDNLFYSDSYIQGGRSGSSVYAKGSFTFEKVNDAPEALTTLPEDLNDDNYEALVEGKVFEYDHLESPLATLDTSLVEEAYDGSVIRFLEEHYIEYDFDQYLFDKSILDYRLIYRGRYLIDENKQGNLEITFNGTDTIVNDEVIQEGGYDIFEFDRENNQVRVMVKMDDKYELHVCYKVKEGAIAEAYQLNDLPDLWSDSVVNAALAEIGVEQDTLPRLGQLRVFNVTPVDTESMSFAIDAVFSSLMNSMDSYMNYTSALTERYNFTMSFKDDKIVYISPNGEFELYTDITTSENDLYPCVSLFIKKRTVYYPDQEISAFLSKIRATDQIVDFHADDVLEYTYDTDHDYMMLKLDEATDGAPIVDEIVSRALNLDYYIYNENYEEEGEYPIFISKNNQIAFVCYLIKNESVNYVFISLKAAEDIMIAEYPEDKVAALFSDVDEFVPNFEMEEAKSYQVTYDNSYHPDGTLYIDLKSSASGSAIMERLNDELLDSGYEKLGFTVYWINDDLREVNRTYTDYLVSPDQEVAIFIWGADATDDYPGYVSISVINFVKYGDVKFDGEKRPVGLRASNYTTNYYVGDEFEFDGEVYVIYDDGTSALVNNDDLMFYEFTLPDMETAGTYEMEVFYFEGRWNVGTTITITVSERPAPAVSYIEVDEYVSEYNVGDEYQFEGDVIVYYEDGNSELLDNDLLTVDTSNLDMNTPGTYTVTISYATGNGSIFQDEIEITVYALTPDLIDYTYLNTNDWDIHDSGAWFRVWAWGGEYGLGQWVDVQVDDRTFTFSLYADCTGFKIVRLNPEAECPENWPEEFNKYVYNQTGDMIPLLNEDESPVTFTFN